MKLFSKNKKIKLTSHATLFGRHKPLNTIHKQKKISKPNSRLFLNNSKKKYKYSRKSSPLSFNKYSRSTNSYLNAIIDGRYIFITVVIFLLFGIISARLFNLQVLKVDNYTTELAKATENTIEGNSAPRGRIYDRNHKLIVDNEAVKTIYYKKVSGVTSLEEIDLAYKVANLIEVDYSKLTDKILKDFWYASNKEEAQNKITSQELQKYKERKFDDNDLEDLIYERITEEDLSIYNDLDKEAAYIYYLMNKGYSYAEKIIKNVDVSNEEYALISEHIDDLPGFNTKVDWERVYNYGDTFKSILGSVSSSNQGIPSELKDYYLKNGYSLDDRVGISYLEYQYENYLKGTKSVYRVLSDNSYELVSEGKRGNDLVLTIDIELPEGYFVGGTSVYGNKSLIVCIICIITSIAMFILWFKNGKDLDSGVPTVEFYAPDNLDPAEIGYLYKNDTGRRLAVSLIVSLASKGYIKIIDSENKEDHVIMKNPDKEGVIRPAMSENEVIVYNGLFKNSDATQLSTNYDFYEVFDEIAKNVHQKFDDEVNDLTAYKSMVVSSVCFLICVVLLGIAYCNFEDLNPSLNILYLVAALANAGTFILTILMKRKNSTGERIKAKISGFRNYIEVAEKSQIDMFVLKNPNYFYDILPYAYVLGVSKKWINKFENIPMPLNDMGTFDFSNIDSLDNLADSVYVPSSSSSSSGSSGCGGGCSSCGGGCSSCGGGGSW